MRLQALLTREYSVAKAALDVARRCATLLHKIRESVGARSTTTMTFCASACTRSGTGAARSRAVFFVLRGGTRAAWTEIQVAYLLVPTPWTERLAHRWAAIQRFRRRTRLSFRCVECHFRCHRSLICIFCFSKTTFSLTRSTFSPFATQQPPLITAKLPD